MPAIIVLTQTAIVMMATVDSTITAAVIGGAFLIANTLLEMLARRFLSHERRQTAGDSRGRRRKDHVPPGHDHRRGGSHDRGD